jgi:hypothetical protein
MSDDNTQGAAAIQNTHMATARLAAANTWLQEEIKRLRLTDAEREAIAYYVGTGGPDGVDAALRSLLERTK